VPVSPHQERRRLAPALGAAPRRHPPAGPLRAVRCAGSGRRFHLVTIFAAG